MILLLVHPLVINRVSLSHGVIQLRVHLLLCLRGLQGENNFSKYS